MMKKCVVVVVIIIVEKHHEQAFFYSPDTRCVCMLSGIRQVNFFYILYFFLFFSISRISLFIDHIIITFWPSAIDTNKHTYMCTSTFAVNKNLCARWNVHFQYFKYAVKGDYLQCTAMAMVLMRMMKNRSCRKWGLQCHFFVFVYHTRVEWTKLFTWKYANLCLEPEKEFFRV